MNYEIKIHHDKKTGTYDAEVRGFITTYDHPSSKEALSELYAIVENILDDIGTMIRKEKEAE